MRIEIYVGRLPRGRASEVAMPNGESDGGTALARRGAPNV